MIQRNVCVDPRDWIAIVVPCVGMALILYLGATVNGAGRLPWESPVRTVLDCTQQPARAPIAGNDSWLAHLSHPQFVTGSVQRFAGAVRIPTESFDADSGNGRENLLRFRKHLEDSFPLVHSLLNRTIIHDYSLLFTWQGSDASLPPLLLMAHQDTVPVLPETRDEWTHDPFSGFMDWENDLIWGRGSADTKASVMGSLEAVEALLRVDFRPRKTVYLAFGHDEEAGGFQGGKFIAQYMQETLGLTTKVGMIVDEGLESIFSKNGFDFAVVSVSEKGIAQYDVMVEAPGGHSSVPPLHTAIGLTARLIARIEETPFQPALTSTNPYLQTLVCDAQHNPNADAFVKHALNDFKRNNRAIAEYLSSRSLVDRYKMSTSQAVDIIKGGLKVNALPEHVLTTVSDRVSVDSSVREVQEALFENLISVARELNVNLTVRDFRDNSVIVGKYSEAGAVGKVDVKGQAAFCLEPSPVSPSKGPVWSVLEGTIHHVYDRDENEMTVMPGLMSGNSDTKFFWPLSSNIYRFSPAAGGEGYHTVNEKVAISGFMKGIAFYHELIRNYDEL
ncbi:hypothetical protein BC830DRAFT_1122665 [Chytriomyces sp. MP71]|nr:hypothetical protein BC830DRAFT_1122665 [Chytriomyces sp. MP71]